MDKIRDKKDYWEQLNKSEGKRISGYIANKPFQGKLVKMDGTLVCLDSGISFDYTIIDDLWLMKD